jgi:hypothetical protein
MSISQKAPIFRIFYANDWNNPEQTILQINTPISVSKHPGRSDQIVL